MIYVNDYSIKVVRSYLKFLCKKFLYKFCIQKLFYSEKKLITVEKMVESLPEHRSIDVLQYIVAML